MSAQKWSEWKLYDLMRYAASCLCRGNTPQVWAKRASVNGRYKKGEKSENAHKPKNIWNYQTFSKKLTRVHQHNYMHSLGPLWNFCHVQLFPNKEYKPRPETACLHSPVDTIKHVFYCLISSIRWAHDTSQNSHTVRNPCATNKQMGYLTHL